MIDALDIGYAIKDRRTQLGLTQAQVADRAGVSKRFLWTLELGQNPGVQLNKLTAVFKALGLELNIRAGCAPSAALEEDGGENASGEPTPPNTAPHDRSDNVDFDALAILTGGKSNDA